jgi:hypothetical protein
MANLEPEAGIFYAVCWIVVLVRLTSRRLHRGAWKRLQLDDYLILAALVRIPLCIGDMAPTAYTLIGHGHRP